MIVSYANLRDDSLGAWIDANVAFPNSMVDRITPQTTDADRAMVARTFGIADAWPVVTEPFKQWVIEDTFSNGRPPLDEVGAEIPIDDPMSGALHALAAQGGEDPRPLLGVHSIFGDLNQNQTFVTALEKALHDLYTGGAKATLAAYMASPSA